MPDKRISQLDNATTPLTGAELVPLDQSGNTVKALISDIASALAQFWDYTANTLSPNSTTTTPLDTFTVSTVLDITLNATRFLQLFGEGSILVSSNTGDVSVLSTSGAVDVASTDGITTLASTTSEVHINAGTNISVSATGNISEVASGTVGVTGTGDVTITSSTGTATVAGTGITLFGPTDVINYFNFHKVTAPGNSTANEGYLFLRDNGAGKMQLAAHFPSGAVQAIATEP